MNLWLKTLEFDTILEKLAEQALSQRAKERLLALEPLHSESECRFRQQETSDAKRILESLGTPPVTEMAGLEAILEACEKGAVLQVDALESVARFLNACRRMKQYLERAQERVPCPLAGYGAAFRDLETLHVQINGTIRDGRVEDHASALLRDMRRKMQGTQDAIRSKLENFLRSQKAWFTEGYVSQRGGHMVLPVKREFRSRFPGRVVDISSTGSTCFMEPHAVAELQEELQRLALAEENEVLRILYELTGLVAEAAPELAINRENMETLDFAFAKAKLSCAMRAREAQITTGREIVIRQGRHPLLKQDACVPLDFVIGQDHVRGVVITGPNTGGKTVALKTVGLLSAMAQCGLHVPAEEDSIFAMHNLYLADIGDGQSIAENLSTFSAHMATVIRILEAAGTESLVLLDELGSGTDPAEGMGIAAAVLEELRERGCLFVATTHYPEIKEYADRTPEITNARMAFDRESLRPLYRLEIGEAGESCALYIAKTLGLPRHMLARAYEAAYHASVPRSRDTETLPEKLLQDAREPVRHSSAPGIRKIPAPSAKPAHRDLFLMGDSVIVYPGRIRGIIYRPCDEKGEAVVQIRGKKQRINHKRLKLEHAASELYPEGYDFSVIFDSVENRKARHQMGKRHVPGLETHEEPEI